MLDLDLIESRANRALDGEDITHLRRQAAAIVASFTPVAIRHMASKHWQSDAWVRRFLRHTAYWRPQRLIETAQRLGLGLDMRQMR